MTNKKPYAEVETISHRVRKATSSCWNGPGRPFSPPSARRFFVNLWQVCFGYVAMVEYLPPLPPGGTGGKEWKIAYMKSISGILKFVQMVGGLYLSVVWCLLLTCLLDRCCWLNVLKRESFKLLLVVFIGLQPRTFHAMNSKNIYTTLIIKLVTKCNFSRRSLPKNVLLTAEPTPRELIPVKLAQIINYTYYIEKLPAVRLLL